MPQEPPDDRLGYGKRRGHSTRQDLGLRAFEALQFGRDWREKKVYEVCRHALCVASTKERQSSNCADGFALQKGKSSKNARTTMESRLFVSQGQEGVRFVYPQKHDFLWDLIAQIDVVSSRSKKEKLCSANTVRTFEGRTRALRRLERTRKSGRRRRRGKTNETEGISRKAKHRRLHLRMDNLKPSRNDGRGWLPSLIFAVRFQKADFRT